MERLIIIKIVVEWYVKMKFQLNWYGRLCEENENFYFEKLILEFQWMN